MNSRALVGRLVTFTAGASLLAACADEAREVESMKEAAEKGAHAVEFEARGLEKAAGQGAAAETERDLDRAAREAAAKAESEGVEGSLEEATEALEQNLEASMRAGRESYDAARKQGEGRVEAAGDAYEAVLEIPAEEDAEREKN